MIAACRDSRACYSTRLLHSVDPRRELLLRLDVLRDAVTGAIDLAELRAGDASFKVLAVLERDALVGVAVDDERRLVDLAEPRREVDLGVRLDVSNLAGLVDADLVVGERSKGCGSLVLASLRGRQRARRLFVA